ncbi:MAG: hypothetical protein ACFFAO_21820 [Candidatus Hermodarchaeota archaeon]
MDLNLMQAKSKKITLGTKEWADSNVNCYFGCSNNCRYCYAKKIAIRFKRKTEDTWKIMDPNTKNIKKNYGKRNGRVMFPTSHDITKESLNGCLIVLNKLIKAKNKILITTKPVFEIIKKICHIFEKNKDLIQFRFTITSNNNNILKFWEPEAPKFEERIEALKYAYMYGYRTSISIEPFLDKNPIPLIRVLIPYVTESIWIGKMNYIRINKIPQNFKNYYRLIREANTKRNLKIILRNLNVFPESIIQIKDSIKNYLSN